MQLLIKDKIYVIGDQYVTLENVPKINFFQPENLIHMKVNIILY